MRVARLEAFGFKSFMDRLVLPLEAGITGVVGPNGCGKSNIVDALRWVLGESRASQLRGGTLEDVIFNGTDKLRPLGLAEVTITLRATQQDFFSDLVSPEREAEILVQAIETESSAIATVQVESVASEAEEITTQAKESSRPHLTVISGSRSQQTEVVTEIVDEQVTAQMVEAALAPAAEEVAEQLDSTEAVAETQPEIDATAETTENQDKDEDEPAKASMLARYAWLRSVSEVQVTRRLYRSGESEYFINRVACRLKDIKDFFRAIGIGARAHTIVAQGEVTRIISAKPQERRLILEEAAGVLGFRDKIASATRRLEETTVNVSRIDDVIHEVTRQVNSLRLQASRARNRQGLKDDIRRLESLLVSDELRNLSRRQLLHKTRSEELLQQEATSSAAVDKARASEEEARAEMLRIDLETDTLRSRIDSFREELSRRTEQKAKFTSRCNELRAFGLARGTEIRRLEEQEKTLTQRSQECENELTQLAAKESTLAESLQGLSHDSAEELRAIASRRDELRAKLRAKEQELQSLRDKRVSAEASIEALEEQIVAASPLNQLKDTLGGEDLEGLRSLTSQTSLFAEGLTVPAKYAKAVQSFLAERAKYIVASEPEKIANYFAQKVATRQSKKASALGVFRGGSVAPSESTSSESAVSQLALPTLLAQLQVAEHCSFAASRIFSLVFIAESLDQAFAFFKSEIPEEIRAEATVVTVDGDIITDHSYFSFRSESGLIHLKRRVTDLQEECGRVEAASQAIVDARDELQGLIKSAEEQHSKVLRESQERQAKAREISNQLGNVRGRLQAAQRLSQQVVQDKNRIKHQITEAQQKIEEYKSEELRIQEEMREFDGERDKQIHEDLAALKRDYDGLEGIRKQSRELLSENSKVVDLNRKALDQARHLASQCNLELQKISLEQQNVCDRIRTEYGEELLAELIAEGQKEGDLLSAETRSEHTQELSKLRTRINREGEVDPTSIERFEEENKRLEDLEKQKHDLETASQTLQRTIARLTETSEKRFLATFAAVQDNFTKLVPRLFGGGKAELELQDPAHPLESGVEIMVRPPGKKPKTIELLSGGEKALCATALIFSMFLVRPSPLCVLDEVDAPLDEANLVRFLALVKEMSLKTQFIVITHNKSSMTVCDNLVGVTQSDPGASRIIAVSLQEAYSQVA